MKNETVKPPVWFWIVGILALLWNLMGVGAYLQEAYMSVAALEQMDQAQRELLEGRPPWVTGVFAIAVWGGLLGSIFLLARKKWAVALFIVSLLGVLAQQVYIFFLSNTIEVYGTGALLLPILVVLVAIFLIPFSQWAQKKHFIN